MAQNYKKIFYLRKEEAYKVAILYIILNQSVII